MGRRFVEAMGALTPNDLAATEAERRTPGVVAEHEESLARERLMTDPARLHLAEREEGLEIGVNVPEMEAERQAMEASPAARYQERSIRLSVWASGGFHRGQIQEGMTVEEAVDEARILYRTPIPEPHARGPYSDPTLMRMVAPGAVVGVAALAVHHKGRALGTDRLTWCRAVLLESARDATPADTGLYAGIGGVGTYAARGLGALAGLDPTDREAVRALFGLFPSLSEWTLEEAFKGLAGSWDTQPDLCWGALALFVGLMQNRWFRREDAELWRRVWAAVDAAADQVVSRTHAAEPSIPLGCHLWTKHLGVVLDQVPVAAVSEGEPGRTRLRALFRALLAWTLNEGVLADEPRRSPARWNDRPEHRHPEWDPRFGAFTARYAAELDGPAFREEVLGPLLDVWPGQEEPLGAFMGAFLGEHLYWKTNVPERAWEHWRATCEAVLGHPAVRRLEGERQALPHNARGALEAVLLRHHGNWLKRDWPHAARVEDLVGRWVEVVGSEPRCFGHLVTFLDGPGWSLGAARALGWLTSCVVRAGGVRSVMEEGVAYRLSKLLWRLWSERRRDVAASGVALRQLSDLADGLVEEGEAMGGLLQRALERRDLAS